MNTVKGLTRFQHRDMINGTTQAFDEAYYRYSNRRLRILRGEYGYHKRVVKNFVFLDDENGNYIPLEDNDWVITSYPFCGNGSLPPHFETLQNDCLEKNIPLLLDCAWFGTCRDITIDVYHPSITEVCFSLTKGIGLGNIRSGIRYSNYDDDLPIRQQNNYNHLPLGAAQVGIWQMKEFSADFIPEKYSNMYDHVCTINGLTQTNCMMIAMLDKKHEQYNDYLIDQVYSKVGIREAIKKQRQTNSDPVLCKAPFTSIYYKGSANEIAFCCAQEDRLKLDNYDSINHWWNSDYAQKFRQSFIDGKFPPQCHVCEWQEKNDIESDRPGYDHLPLVQPNIITGNVKEKPQYIDYRPDNLCNLMCTMCSPSNSSLVEKIYKQFPDVFGNQKDYSFDQSSQDRILKDKIVNEDTLKLKVLGGEPTINKKVHDAFHYCVDNDYAKNIELAMTTNFTNLNSTYKLIEQFKQVKIQASIDGTGPTYEYIRKPARWKKIKENMLEFSDRFEGNNKFRFGLNCVFQPVSAFTVKEWLPEMLTFFYDEMKIKRWGITMLAITGPTGLTFGALPQKFREVVVNDLLDIQNNFKDHSNERLQNNISSMIKYVTDFEEYDYKKLKSFKVKVKTFDKAKKTDITTLSPLFTELLNYEQ
jgi:sulfatase maturation enzyme AslB (radical SAM superfamily)